MDATSQKERAGAGVVKLFAVVALNRLDRGTKLGTHIGEEVSQTRIRVRLKS